MHSPVDPPVRSTRTAGAHAATGDIASRSDTPLSGRSAPLVELLVRLHGAQGPWRRHLLALVDVGSLLVFALLCTALTGPGGERFLVAFLLIALGQFLLVRAAGLHHRIWSAASALDVQFLALIVGGVASLTIVVAAAALSWLGAGDPLGMVERWAIAASAGLGTVTALLAPRMLSRLVASHAGRRREALFARADGRPVLIVGAGETGRRAVEAILRDPQREYHPVGFIDDNPAKRGRRLAGIPVLGGVDALAAIAARLGVRHTIIAMPSAHGSTIRRVVAACHEARLEARTIPSMQGLASGRVTASTLRSVRVEDLLRRPAIHTDLDAVRSMIEGRVVLVTGAGGSIGGELCRQIARLGVRELVLVGRGENSIHEISLELRHLAPALTVHRHIADVRDRLALDAIFDRHRPALVFHAAAHKHVPLMEDAIPEAITNNVQGTDNVAQCCVAYDVERLVLISTDKAVRPSSVMGATKRVAEQVVQGYAARHRRNFVAVRFGNVLGSRGSVIPTFLRQIEAGGPVTVTHPDVTRYFITIPEAVELVLQATVLGRGGEIFMLDMGQPVRIVDLARDMLRLGGHDDIAVTFSGLRPGEKMYEELYLDFEEAAPTAHEKVVCVRSRDRAGEDVTEIAELCRRARQRAGDSELRDRLRELIPDFTGAPAPEVSATR